MLFYGAMFGVGFAGAIGLLLVNLVLGLLGVEIDLANMDLVGMISELLSGLLGGLF